jgi:hypothetical protein
MGWAPCIEICYILADHVTSSYQDLSSTRGKSLGTRLLYVNCLNSPVLATLVLQWNSQGNYTSICVNFDI